MVLPALVGGGLCAMKRVCCCLRHEAESYPREVVGSYKEPRPYVLSSVIALDGGPSRLSFAYASLEGVSRSVEIRSFLMRYGANVQRELSALS